MGNNISHTDRYQANPKQSELKSYMNENLQAEMKNFFNPNRVLGNLRYLNKHTQPNPINSLNYIMMNSIPFQNNYESQNSQKNNVNLSSSKIQLKNLDQMAEFLIEKIRQKLISRGISGILSLGKSLLSGDNDNSRKINFFDFSNLCYKYGLGLNDSEIKSVFASMDYYRSCFINYDEFLQRVRGYLKPSRLTLVENAFNSIDKFNQRQLDYFDICGAYDASLHPLVKSGKDTPEGVYNDFLSNLKINHSISSLNKSNFLITIDEFIEYHEYVSMFVDDDQYFKNIMACWKNMSYNKSDLSNNNFNNRNFNTESNLEQNNNNRMQNFNKSERKPLQNNIITNNYQNQNNNNQRLNNSYNIFGRDDLPQNILEKAEFVLNKFRQKLISMGQFALFNLTKQFVLMDNDNYKTFNFDDLVNISKEFKVDLSQSEAINLFQALDKKGQYFVDTQHFLNLLKGEMNDRRKNIVKLAFKILDVENKGTIELGYLKKRFNVRNNIDVLLKRKSEEEAFGEFMHSLEYHFSSYKDRFDRRINLDEFIDYYNMVSFCIENDEHFEVMIKSTWKF